MAFYQPSKFFKQLIAERYGREPIEYPQLGKQEYEDLEYVRSKMYENGEMSFLIPSTKEKRALAARRRAAITKKMDDADL